MLTFGEFDPVCRKHLKLGKGLAGYCYKQLNVSMSTYFYY